MTTRDATPPRLDLVASLLVAALLLVGLVMVASASVPLAGREGHAPLYYLMNQLLPLGVGLAAGALLLQLPLHHVERLSMPLVWLAIIGLVLVMVPGIGKVANGSRRWINVMGIGFQVSELARLFIMIYVASYAVRREQALRSGFRGLLPPLLLAAAAALLIFIEPDLGGAMVLMATVLMLLLVAGARWSAVALPMACVAGLGALAVVFTPYRLTRLMSFQDPWADPFDSGFQLAQSLIAIGRGGWFGVGLGDSMQKQAYLPEAHTDFLFAVIAEETGLVGVVVLVGLYLALVWRVFQIARRAEAAGHRFAAYIAAGFGLWLGVQALFNIGVNMGVLPTKGLTLPLASYGRSSLMVTLLWFALVMRANHEVLGGRRLVAGALRRRAGTAAIHEVPA
ncbi:MAG: hypothetical protein RL026_508 [Pseudomonadota bacterium]